MTVRAGPEGARRGLALGAIGSLACLACCTGPVLGFLAAAGIATAVAALWAGAMALVVGGLTVAGVVLLRRRRHRLRAVAPVGPVPVAGPEVRSRSGPATR